MFIIIVFCFLFKTTNNKQQIGRGEIIEAAPGFQLFATKTIYNQSTQGQHTKTAASNSKVETEGLLSSLFSRVMIDSLSLEGLEQF